MLWELSGLLIQTYNQINKNYYQKQRGDGHFPRKKKGASADYVLSPTVEIFNNRYRVCGEKLGAVSSNNGSGTFGLVVAAVDMCTGANVAIKIIKKKDVFAKQTQAEVSILEILQRHRHQHPGSRALVQFIEAFMHKEHLCLVFERLYSNLFELLRKTNFNGFKLSNVRKFVSQILVALDALAQPNVNVIHCDLKPENIVLVRERRSELKIIDFGNACHPQEQALPYIQSRFYRAPEVILGLKITAAIDMWSLGCIMVEMHTGKPLFAGRDKFDQLRKITNVLGMPPREMIEQSSKRREFFDEIVVVEGDNRLIDYRLKAAESPKNPATQTSDGPRSLAEIIGTKSDCHAGLPGFSPHEYQLFLDLLQRMLDFNPSTRITPAEASRHPFMLLPTKMTEKEKKAKCMRSNYMADVSGEWDTQSIAIETSRIIKQRRLHPNPDAEH
ncbi:TPA: hypothetical protein N0F65_003073 [Lagenidium giganteum]|uniref:Protein kinase domain-containing protein n=1 Tax=Lagenidium giganteum TaxID=4803 RepID=A0AAV2YNJ8_9STRA|nr:TPA: hypothetical protein N0F65_003073 [Lagenidium giganteum]